MMSYKAKDTNECHFRARWFCHQAQGRYWHTAHDVVSGFFACAGMTKMPALSLV
jgi:hypothetical protein